MYKEVFKKIIKEKLTEEEKTEGLLALKSFISTHETKIVPEEPIENNPLPPAKSPILSPFFINFIFREKLFVQIGMIVLIISVTGGTVLAANFSLPGDLLYPVKININEKVQTIVSVGTESKIDTKIEHLNERFKEAETLLTKKRLTKENKKEIEINLSKEVEVIDQKMTVLKDEGKEKESSEIEVKFTNSIQNHKEILLELFTETENNSTSTPQSEEEEKEKNDKEKLEDIEKKYEKINENEEIMRNL